MDGQFLSKKAITIKDSLENLLTSSQRKPNLIESDRGKEFFNNFFQKVLRNINFINFKHYSRKTHLGVVFAENLIELLEIFLKDLFLKKLTVIGLKLILPTITKQCYIGKHSSIKLTPLQVSL